MLRFWCPRCEKDNPEEETQCGGCLKMVKPWDYPIKLVYGAERLVDVLVRVGWCESKSQAKQLIKGGGIKLDGQVATSETVLEPPPQGILMSKSRRHFLCLQPAYDDPLWDEERDGEFRVDQLVKRVEDECN